MLTSDLRSGDQVTAPGFSTRAIHAGYDPETEQGALVPPIHMSATFTAPSAGELGDRFSGDAAGYFYSRISNPTVDLLERRFAALEGAEAALGTASGMGAISATLWTLLRPGDEIIVDKTLYGCTFAFMRHGLARFGVVVHHVDLTDPDALDAAMTKRTRLVYFETPANPNMRLIDIAAVAERVRAHGGLTMVDNTYCTPCLARPLALGADIVVHSATKYLSGHGDVVAGLVAGRRELMDEVRLFGLKDMTGAVMSPMSAMLVMRGLKTLSLRMERHSQSAEQIARFLSAHPAVAKVHYPYLGSNRDRDLAVRQMALGGGMIAFEMTDGLTAGRTLIDSLKLIRCAVSLGDAESLIQHPATMTHSTYTPEERAAYGIDDGLVRLSVGLEDVGDILNDLDLALPA